MNEINENDTIIKREILQLASSNSFLSTSALLLNVIIISIAFWDISDKSFLLLWIMSITILLITRSIIAKSFLKNPLKNPIAIEEKKFKILSISTVILFSIGLIVVFPQNKPFYQAFLSMILGGISAGVVMSLSYYQNLLRVYLIILIIPFTYIIYNQNTQLHTLIAILTIIFLIVLMLFSKKYHKIILNLINSTHILNYTQKQKQISEDNFYSIFNEAPVGILTYNKDLIITQANQTFAAYIKVPLKKIIGLDIKRLEDKRISPSLEIVFKGEKGFYEGNYNTTISDEEIWITLQTVPMKDTDNNIIGGLGIVENITKHIESEQKIKYQAFYDHLTGLANRLTLNDRIEQQLARLSRHKRYGAILFIDLDNFKTINDSLGHHIGDELLKTFALRTNEIIRKEDTVARLGGDEFVILLSDLSSNELHATKNSHQIANKLHESMKIPITVEEYSLHVTLSIGINIISPNEGTINDILKYADIAMYQAKESGRNTTRFYKDEMSKQIQEQLTLNNELRKALELNQFELYFQPIVEIETDKIISCEALIRWNHPKKGLIYPDQFIPFAEESDLIIDIGDWVINAACNQYKDFNASLMDIAINISPRQFIQKDFVGKILAVTTASGINPSNLKLELTESVAVDNLSDTIKKMNTLKHHGFKIAMDDFGTGYSSLSYLKNLPFDIIKIDRSFIKDMLNNEEDASLIKAILTISKQLKFAVIAEGVETKEHISVLKALECDYYQGYVKSKPIPANKFKKLLTKSS